jgi:hypothetical protein
VEKLKQIPTYCIIIIIIIVIVIIIIIIISISSSSIGVVSVCLLPCRKGIHFLCICNKMLQKCVHVGVGIMFVFWVLPSQKCMYSPLPGRNASPCPLHDPPKNAQIIFIPGLKL